MYAGLQRYNAHDDDNKAQYEPIARYATAISTNWFVLRLSDTMYVFVFLFLSIILWRGKWAGTESDRGHNGPLAFVFLILASH